MSLAHPLSNSYPSSLFSNSPSPFAGSNGVMENEFGTSVDGCYHRNDNQHNNNSEYVPPPLSAVGGPTENQIDFVRGFGLDVHLESEEEGEMMENDSAVSDVKELESVPEEPEEEGGDRTQDMDLDDEDHSRLQHSTVHQQFHLPPGITVEIDDASTTGPESRLHSRHVSRLSAALSLRSVGGNFSSQVESAQREMEERRGGFEALDELRAGGQVDVEDKQSSSSNDYEELERPVDPVDEWTGSEDEVGLTTLLSSFLSSISY